MSIDCLNLGSFFYQTFLLGTHPSRVVGVEGKNRTVWLHLEGKIEDV